jgi:uncharacterized membrane protein (UPF0127 family)
MKFSAIFTDAGELVASHVSIANTFASRLIGLLNRRGLRDEEGLLLQPGGSIHTFAMRFPIDVLFLDEQGRVLLYHPSLKPWRVAFAPPRTRYVLELAAGRIRRLESATLRVALP